MIEQITQKEFKRLTKYKELAPGKKLGYLIFLGKDGKYYKTGQDGMVGAREMFEWQQMVKKSLDSQTSLI
jgi:hypothetical protein